MNSNLNEVTKNLLLMLTDFCQQKNDLAKDFEMNHKGNRIHFCGNLKKNLFTFYVIFDPFKRTISLTSKWKSPSQKDSPYGYSGLVKNVGDFCEEHYGEFNLEEDRKYESKRKNNSFFQVRSTFSW